MKTALLLLGLFFSACTRDSGATNVQISAALATTKTPPLFVYTEGGDTLSFWSPDRVRLVRATDGGTKACETALPVNGNMYSGRDVETAFRDRDVQAALKAHGRYTGKTTASLSDGTDTLSWGPSGAAQPLGLSRFETVIGVVVFNRRMLC